MSDPQLEIKGKLRSVWWADEKARQSYEDALQHCKAAKQDSLEAQFHVLLQKIADYPVGHRRGIQKSSFPDEGKLPGRPGKPGGKYQAVKKIPIRAYGWSYESEGHPKIQKEDFVISHCVHKDYQKKKKEEDKRIAQKWRKLEAE